MRKTAAATLFAWSALAAGSPLEARAGFDVIEGRALGVSADGCAVVGSAVGPNGSQAFRWKNGVSIQLFPEPLAYSTANGISANGEVVVGQKDGARAYRLDPPGGSLLTLAAGTPHEALAVSADGQSIGGCVHALQNGLHCDWPFYWRDGAGRLLRDLTGSFSFGAVNALSSDGRVAAGGAGGSALLWRPAEDGIQDLGKLPGHLFASVRALTPDAAIAVGTSRASSASSARAFRWTAASGIVELGPATRVARGISADGKRIVGEGEFDGVEQAFIWDALYGARPLADVLRDEYGFDLGGVELIAATAISPDGKTIVGTGSDPNGSRGWRARMREEPCPVLPATIELVDPSTPSDAAIVGPGSLGIDSHRRLSVSGNLSRNLWRIGTSPETLADPPIEHLLDFSSAAPEEWETPIVFAVGADDSVYVGAQSRQQILRVDANGAVHVAFDGSGYPPIESVGEVLLPTTPHDAALAPDGNLYISTEARVLRLDPDGSVHELIDVAAVQEAIEGNREPVNRSLGWIEVTPQGRVYLATSYEILLLDGQSGQVLEIFPISAGQFRGIEADVEGGLWVFGPRLLRIGPNGVIEEVIGYEIPDGAGGILTGGYGGITELAVDEQLNVYYAGDAMGDSWSSNVVVRRTPEGASTQIVGPKALDWYRWYVYVSDLLVSDGVLFVSDHQQNRVIRVELPVRTTQCTNGIDDDSDGLVDFPADTGCLSRADDGERSFERPCDNGIDDDHDGVADFPADPGCVSLTGPYEKTECDDGLDNDGDGSVDWDGKVDEWGNEYPPDSECAGDARRVIEHPWYCGLGFEVAIVVLPLTQAARRWRMRRRAAAA